MTPVYMIKQSTYDNPDEDIEKYVIEGVMDTKIDTKNLEMEIDLDTNSSLTYADFRSQRGENFFKMYNRVTQNDPAKLQRGMTFTILQKQDEMEENELFWRGTHGYSTKMPGGFNYKVNTSNNKQTDRHSDGSKSDDLER